MTASKLPTLPSVSLVVPTYNREEPLKSTLIDCVAQDYPNFEVIVVDQTKEHTPEVAEYLDAAKTAGKITLFTPDFASLPGARNYAIRRAKGDIIIFIDDDIREEIRDEIRDRDRDDFRDRARYRNRRSNKKRRLKKEIIREEIRDRDRDDFRDRVRYKNRRIRRNWDKDDIRDRIDYLRD